MISSKKLEKIEKILGDETLSSLMSLDNDGLFSSIVLSESSMKEAQEELEANPKYQELKENLKAISQGLKDVKKLQRAKIDYILHLLEERGQS